MAAKPEGVPDRVIAQVLQISEEEVEVVYQEAVEKLRAALRP